MGYNRIDYNRIYEEYKTKPRTAETVAARHELEVNEKIPGMADINSKMHSFFPRLMANMLGEDNQSAVEVIKEENLRLQEKRRKLLLSYGYPEDYLEIKYNCSLCGDTGFTETGMCVCMRKQLVDAGYKSSGMAEIIKVQTFDTFSLEYYKQDKELYGYMSDLIDRAKKYAENFTSDKCKNLILTGNTGLGKTHISSAIANEVVKKGFDVYYNMASGMIADFEKERFGNSSFGEGDADDTDRYYSCDLLIIDDLGTEISNQFTSSCIYNVINKRLITNKSTIISTNLTSKDIREHYSDRITSRIFGNYLPLQFRGYDIRLKKLH